MPEMPINLGPQVWLRDDATIKVMAALGEGAARFVGGCVRNTILGEDVGDIDIATTHTPGKVMAVLEGAGIKAVPTGIDHGTVTAVVDGKPFEITTLRKDVATDGRHADVAFGTSWEEDAARRDFTMNALYADADGTLYDPLGGYGDAKARVVKFIGDPVARIKEDYLRILRFFRFNAHYAQGDYDKAGLTACADNKDGIAGLSRERIQAELLKLLAAPRALDGLRSMAAAGVLVDVLPEASEFERFGKLVEIETTQLFACDPILRLGALLPSDAEMIGTLAKRLKLSNDARDRLLAMHTDATTIKSYLSIREVRKALYWMGAGLFKDRVMLLWAMDPKLNNAVQWRALLAMADSWQKPKFPLTGQDVMAARVPEGAEVGRVMREVEEWWVDADFIDDRLSLIERLKAVVQATVY